MLVWACAGQKRKRDYTRHAVKKGTHVKSQFPAWTHPNPPTVHYANIVFAHLTNAQQRMVNMQQFDQLAAELSKTKRGAGKRKGKRKGLAPQQIEGNSVWDRAAKDLDEHCPAPWKRDISPGGKRRLLQRWFWRWFRDGQSAEHSRRPQGEPTEAEWAVMYRALRHERYSDGEGNERKFADLAHFCDEAEMSSNSLWLSMRGTIEGVCHRLKRRLWQLTEDTAARYGMRPSMEKFKDKRQDVTAQREAQMLNGEIAMFEEAGTHKAGKLNARTGKPQEPVWHQQIVTSAPLNATRRQLAGGQQAAGKLKFDEGAWQITACIDGTAVHAHVDPKVASNRVWLGVRLPCSSHMTACTCSRAHSASWHLQPSCAEGCRYSVLCSCHVHHNCRNQRNT